MIELTEAVASCPICDADVFATVNASGGEMVGEEFVVTLRVVALSGCPHVAGWHPDGGGEPLPIDKAA